MLVWPTIFHTATWQHHTTDTEISRSKTFENPEHFYLSSLDALSLADTMVKLTRRRQIGKTIADENFQVRNTNKTYLFYHSCVLSDAAASTGCPKKNVTLLIAN